jgi:hypothetical protein
MFVLNSFVVLFVIDDDVYGDGGRLWGTVHVTSVSETLLSECVHCSV